jgi:hypothetical protein
MNLNRTTHLRFQNLNIVFTNLHLSSHSFLKLILYLLSLSIIKFVHLLLTLYQHLLERVEHNLQLLQVSISYPLHPNQPSKDIHMSLKIRIYLRNLVADEFEQAASLDPSHCYFLEYLNSKEYIFELVVDDFVGLHDNPYALDKVIS